VICSVAIVLVAVLFAIAWPGEREPEYQGKKLSGWLREYQENTGAPPPAAKAEELTRAVRRMGTNSLPFLLHWLSYEKPGRKAKLGTLYDKLPGYLWRASVSYHFQEGQFIPSQNAVIWSFCVLGTEGRPALADLERLVKRNKTAMAATMCIGCIGEPAVPKLKELLNSSNSDVRCTARLAIEDMVPRDGWLRTNVETGFASVIIRP